MPLICQLTKVVPSAGLTPTEFKLLYTLALDRGRVVTRDELLQKLWGRRESRRDRTVATDGGAGGSMAIIAAPRRRS